MAYNQFSQKSFLRSESGVASTTHACKLRASPAVVSEPNTSRSWEPNSSSQREAALDFRARGAWHPGRSIDQKHPAFAAWDEEKIGEISIKKWTIGAKDDPDELEVFVSCPSKSRNTSTPSHGGRKHQPTSVERRSTAFGTDVPLRLGSRAPEARKARPSGSSSKIKKTPSERSSRPFSSFNAEGSSLSAPRGSTGQRTTYSTTKDATPANK